MSTVTSNGRVARVIGPVVDIEFPADAMPSIFNALHVEVTMNDQVRLLTLEVAQHIGDNLVRAISMQPTDGLVRGAAVSDTGAAISVPVGDVTKGQDGVVLMDHIGGDFTGNDLAEQATHG